MVTRLSSVRLPKLLRRLVKPVPAAVTVPVDAPAPKIRSLALLVVAVPLFMAVVVPTAAAEASSGSVLSIPAYSWMYMSANELIALLNVARTVLLPAVTFFA